MKTILATLITLTTLANADFTRDDATGIVTDNKTNLQWQDDAIGSTTSMQGAINTCEALELGGHTDWRLPNINELKSIIVDTKVAPSIDGAFQNTTSNSYWSATTNAANTGNAWVVNFSNGDTSNYYKYFYYGYYGNFVYYGRCVRAGQ